MAEGYIRWGSYHQRYDSIVSIIGRGSICAKAAYNINTNIRWCLTGTPL